MRRAWALGFIKFHLPFALSVTQKWQIFFPKFVWGIDDSTDKTAKPYTGSHVCTDVKKGCLENDDLENEDLRPRKRRPRKQRPWKRRRWKRPRKRRPGKRRPRKQRPWKRRPWKRRPRKRRPGKWWPTKQRPRKQRPRKKAAGRGGGGGLKEVCEMPHLRTKPK